MGNLNPANGDFGISESGFPGNIERISTKIGSW